MSGTQAEVTATIGRLAELRVLGVQVALDAPRPARAGAALVRRVTSGVQGMTPP